MFPTNGKHVLLSFTAFFPIEELFGLLLTMIPNFLLLKAVITAFESLQFKLAKGSRI